MTASSLSVGAAPFRVQLPVFEGTLSELAAALRSARVLPSEVPLLELTRNVLAWTQQLTGHPAAAMAETHPDLLPSLAAVIALKARLLLPPEPADPAEVDWAGDELEEMVSSVEALAELDTLVAFLAGRRREREGLIAARPLPLDLPRRQRRQPQGSLARLVQAAHNAVRAVEVPLLSRERLTLADALSALRAFGKRLGVFGFWTVYAEDWSERTTYFAALLEGIKEGEFSAEQGESYGEIEVRCPPGRQEQTSGLSGNGER